MSSPKHDLAQRMAELARATAPPRDVKEVLSGVTAAATEMIPGTDTCGVLLIGKGGKFESLFGTSDLIYKLDALQEACGEGPCVEAALDELIVRTDDFTTERRWPKYSRCRRRTRGAQWVVVQALHQRDHRGCAESVRPAARGPSTRQSEAIGSVLAAHAASAIIASRHGEQLESALTTRDTIGQAKGVIMERFNVDAMRAFEMLRELSQTTNTRLVDIADRVIESRED